MACVHLLMDLPQLVDVTEDSVDKLGAFSLRKKETMERHDVALHVS